MHYFDYRNMPPWPIPGPYAGAPDAPNQAPQDMYSYPQNFPEALTRIRDAVRGEKEDQLFYDYLISVAPSEEDKKIIESIRNDERQHFNLFRQIYFELTGQTLPSAPEASFTKPSSYCQGIQKALFGELGAVERYRIILFAMQERKHINMLTRIITDEQKHAAKYNFLFSKNQCK